MRPITFTGFRNSWDKKGKPETTSWEKWIHILSNHHIHNVDITDDKALKKAKNGPFQPGKFKPASINTVLSSMLNK